MENQLNSIREKLKTAADTAFNLNKISEEEFRFYGYLIKDDTKSQFTYEEALENLEKKQSGYLIDLDENDCEDIEIRFKNTTYYSQPTEVVFNATYILQAIAESTPEEVAQALDQSMVFMIGYMEKAGWTMNGNLIRMYNNLRELRNGIIFGYTNAVLGMVTQYNPKGDGK
ncbi:hypothetical protein AHMF7605_22410 [Adhaeribacter arboris]|uniref:Uncharacterized protein n=1 Tax=Adhaeribacter arboris TaxID=2072846 RepID=A0A2T2YKL4_9BACT|nr:hypothetical protein [Adhaeribacter arboris]PSR56054.1 hypothetical protein AHMF7605_22410 [Adhaeribacter arboris]